MVLATVAIHLAADGNIQIVITTMVISIINEAIVVAHEASLARKVSLVAGHDFGLYRIQVQ